MISSLLPLHLQTCPAQLFQVACDFRSNPMDDENLAPNCDAFAKLFADKSYLIHSNLEARWRTDPVPDRSETSVCPFVISGFRLILLLGADGVLGSVRDTI